MIPAFAIGALVAVVGFGGQVDRRAQLPDLLRTSVKDACEVASASQLRSVLNAGLAPYFPIKRSDDGEHVTVSDPSITDASCPGFRITVRARIRYQKTRGFPQFSTSGDMKFRTPVEVRIQHPFALQSGAAIPADQITGARACLTNINVTDLNLNNVPNWLDDGWIKEKLLDPKLNSRCFDVTSLVQAFINAGGIVRAS